MKTIVVSIVLFLLVFSNTVVFAQSPLPIPPLLSGKEFNLVIQNGSTQFYPGIQTPTYGINGALLAPTLVVRKGDWVTMNVQNTLTGSGNSTTIHWHGLHLPAVCDGGPHQVIKQGTTWSPKFQILNSAGTFWYHPHGEGKTDLHVARGIAGFIFVKDEIEDALPLPRSYGIDDFPVVVQTKAFDVLHQVAVSTEMDTAVCINGAIKPYLNAPAQVIRLRLLNGSSMRSYNFGFTGNHPFTMIASDAGLLDSALPMTRIRLSPGERAEILVDLQGMKGQTLYLKNYGMELPNGIYGAAKVQGMMGQTIPDYHLNHLNGADYDILELRVREQTTNPSPITTLPVYLNSNTLWSNPTVWRTFTFAPDTMMSGMVEGPFNINGSHFDMDIANVRVMLNTTEKWRLENNTGIAHPFHIHDVHFYVTSINGAAVPKWEQGKKDVVLVMPNEYVEFVTRFEDFADNTVPYMYHCHLLHHEDDGMMGSFLVIDPTATADNESSEQQDLRLFPNPVLGEKIVLRWDSSVNDISEARIEVLNVLGQKVLEQDVQSLNTVSAPTVSINTAGLTNGLYSIRVQTKNKVFVQRFIKE